jgi:hypothetical protein
MKRLTIQTLIGVVLVLLAWGLTTRLLARGPGATMENVRRLTSYMTFRQVKAILGEPQTLPVCVWPPWTDWPPDWDEDLGENGWLYEGIWRGEEGTAFVYFNGGLMSEAHFRPSTGASFSRFRDWLLSLVGQ